MNHRRLLDIAAIVATILRLCNLADLARHELHPAHRKEIITPPPLLVPETVGRTTYFFFTPQWFQIGAWRYLTNGGRRACVVWHRRAGKDELAMAFLARAML